MSDISSWTEFNWYALGSLITQLAFFIAAVWFARSFLRAVHALQEQFGALLKLSITSDSQSSGAFSRRRFADLSQNWLMPTDSSTPLPTPVNNGPGQLAVAWHRLSTWLNAPMHSAEASGWRRFVIWLQSPVGS